MVTVARYNSGSIIGSVFGSTPEEILPYLANGLVRVTGWDLVHLYGFGYGQYRPLLVLSPILARMIAKAGWSKADLQQALFEQARIPARTRSNSSSATWTNFIPGRRTLVDLVNFAQAAQGVRRIRRPRPAGADRAGRQLHRHRRRRGPQPHQRLRAQQRRPPRVPHRQADPVQLAASLRCSAIQRTEWVTNGAASKRSLAALPTWPWVALPAAKKSTRI